jgi:hypothetical protein
MSFLQAKLNRWHYEFRPGDFSADTLDSPSWCIRALGFLTAPTLNDAVVHATGRPVAVAYDHIGLDEKWLQHLSWLGQNIQAGRWVKATDWTFAGWEE